MISSLTKEEAEDILKQHVFGHLGCNDGLNSYVYPNNYVYDGKYIYCHSYIGAKIRTMRQNKRVCLQVDEIKDSVNWKSIMVLGDYEELHDKRDQLYAIKTFVNHSLQLKISETAALKEANDLLLEGKLLDDHRPVFYRISIKEITGRYEKT